ncbi:helix-turn-helix domain-containing protein [Brevibacillus panacihumi]|uniref:helix-turn-helix domain-containing protein n=1 Tax=Brevibacillus panacihumi TaxID=497735 RepID=UPI003D02CFF0
MDIRLEFGQRCKELRARSGMSQEILAYRSGLDRSYISGVERGERNISIINIEKIASALMVSVEYMFSGERFSTTPAYQQRDFAEPFLKRFHYQVDPESRVLAFSVKGLLTPQDVDYMDKTLIGICNAFGNGELNLLVDHRDMLAADGQPAVYSSVVAEKAVAFQQKLLRSTKKVAILCNSEFMVHNLRHVTKESGIYEHSNPLFGKDKDMVQQAYELLGINGNELIKQKKQ